MSLFTVRHVFVGFVEGKECGIRNPESGIRNPFNVTCWSILYSFIFLDFSMAKRRRNGKVRQVSPLTLGDFRRHEEYKYNQ